MQAACSPPNDGSIGGADVAQAAEPTLSSKPPDVAAQAGEEYLRHVLSKDHSPDAKMACLGHTTNVIEPIIATTPNTMIATPTAMTVMVCPAPQAAPSPPRCARG
jgi:hypothetical protein